MTLFNIQIQRYNALMEEIRRSLTDLEKGIQGLVVMTVELENIFQCIFDGNVPPSWLKVHLFTTFSVTFTLSSSSKSMNYKDFLHVK